MVDLEIQTLSKPNSIYILALFGDQTNCIFLIPPANLHSLPTLPEDAGSL